MPGQRRIVIGRIRGAIGVHGWVRVESFCQPPDGILGYERWQIERPDGWRDFRLLEGQRHGPGFIAHLATEQGKAFAERDDAMALMGASVAVDRDEFAPLQEGEYYWADLEGLSVDTSDGVPLGVVDRVFETGANDVLVVKGEREHLIPFVQGPVVKTVDLESGLITVDWDPDF